MITSAQERDYYDDYYRQFLKIPDHALRLDRKIFEANLDNPTQPCYERRIVYRAAMRALDAEPFSQKHVLDYGCGPADFGLWMATEGACVTLLDVSPVVIELGLKRAAASGVAVRGVASDASRLGMFHDAEFDLVFACAALHHTLKYPGAVEELARIMKPGGRLVLCETWGGNPLLNAARRIRSAIEGEPEEKGEKILFSTAELRELAPYFDSVSVEGYNLLAMGKRLLRGRFQNRSARFALRTLETTDAALLAVAPFLQRWCGEAVITARRMKTS